MLPKKDLAANTNNIGGKGGEERKGFVTDISSTA